MKRIRLIRGWMTDLKELRSIRRMRRNRPKCEVNDGNHHFIEYWGQHYKKCHDCDYKEDLVIKE